MNRLGIICNRNDMDVSIKVLRCTNSACLLHSVSAPFFQFFSSSSVSVSVVEGEKEKKVRPQLPEKARPI